MGPKKKSTSVENYSDLSTNVDDENRYTADIEKYSEGPGPDPKAHTLEVSPVLADTSTDKSKSEQATHEGTDISLESNESSDEIAKKYPLLFEAYYERFQKAYSLSQKLFETERAQRQTLNYYKRRNNTLLDILDQLEDSDKRTPNVEFSIDRDRIDNIINMNPDLKDSLSDLFKLEKLDAEIKKSHKLNLLIDETVPELSNDEMDYLEVNPHDIEPWVIRHCSNMAISKYTPINIFTERMQERKNAEDR